MRVDPNLMTGILRRRENADTHTEKRPREDGGRNWRVTAVSQGRPRTAGNQKLG